MSPTQKEELRRLVRGWLAERAALAYNLTSIQRGVGRELACTEPEVAEACQLLHDLGHLKDVPNSLGSAKYYQIHAQGTLAHERGD